MNNWERERKPSWIVFSSGLMFRVVNVNRNTAALELCSDQDIAAICLLIHMVQTSALKITSS